MRDGVRPAPPADRRPAVRHSRRRLPDARGRVLRLPVGQGAARQAAARQVATTSAELAALILDEAEVAIVPGRGVRHARLRPAVLRARRRRPGRGHQPDRQARRRRLIAANSPAGDCHPVGCRLIKRHLVLVGAAVRRQHRAQEHLGTGFYRCGRGRSGDSHQLFEQQRDLVGPTGCRSWLGRPERRAVRPPCSPAKIKSSGKLVVGVNVPYAPNEFKDPSGKIVGFDVDLMNAIADVLGLTTDYSEADFDKIIPSIQAGTFNVGMSSFTDNKEREKSVDFVTYFSAGILWAAAGGQDDRPGQRLRQEGRGAAHHDPGHRRAAGQEQGVHRRRQAGDRDPAVRQPGRRHQRAWCWARPTPCRPTRR